MKKFMIFLVILNWGKSAYADFNSGLDASAIAIQYIMADPPIPALNLSAEDKKNIQDITLKPGYVTGETKAHYDYGGGAQSDQSGKIKGPTFGASWTRAFHKNWSWFGWVVGTSLSGDFETRQNGEASPTIFSTDVKTSVLNLSFGLNYQMKNIKDDGYAMSLFFGPYIPMYWSKQHYRNTKENFEADLESNQVFYGLLVGAQWEMSFGENWAFNPFVILADTFGSKDFFNIFGNSGECREYKVTNVTAGNFNSAGIGEFDCGNRKEFLFDTLVGGIGLNLEYKPWNISTNLFSPFLNQMIFKLFYEGEEPDLYYLSLSWSF